MAAGLGADALKMLFPHTVASLTLLLVFGVRGEILVDVLPVHGAGRWSLGNDVPAWLTSRYRHFDASVCCSPGQRCSPTQVLTQMEAGLFPGLALLLAVLVLLTGLRRRDV